MDTNQSDAKLYKTKDITKYTRMHHKHTRFGLCLTSFAAREMSTYQF